MEPTIIDKQVIIVLVIIYYGSNVPFSLGRWAFVFVFNKRRPNNELEFTNYSSKIILPILHYFKGPLLWRSH